MSPIAPAAAAAPTGDLATSLPAADADAFAALFADAALAAGPVPAAAPPTPPAADRPIPAGTGGAAQDDQAVDTADDAADADSRPAAIADATIAAPSAATLSTIAALAVAPVPSAPPPVAGVRSADPAPAAVIGTDPRPAPVHRDSMSVPADGAAEDADDAPASTGARASAPPPSPDATSPAPPSQAASAVVTPDPASQPVHAPPAPSVAGEHRLAVRGEPVIVEVTPGTPVAPSVATVETGAADAVVASPPTGGRADVRPRDGSSKSRKIAPIDRPDAEMATLPPQVDPGDAAVLSAMPAGTTSPSKDVATPAPSPDAGESVDTGAPSPRDREPVTAPTVAPPVVVDERRVAVPGVAAAAAPILAPRADTRPNSVAPPVAARSASPAAASEATAPGKAQPPARVAVAAVTPDLAVARQSGSARPVATTGSSGVVPSPSIRAATSIDTVPGQVAPAQATTVDQRDAAPALALLRAMPGAAVDAGQAPPPATLAMLAVRANGARAPAAGRGATRDPSVDREDGPDAAAVPPSPAAAPTQAMPVSALRAPAERAVDAGATLAATGTERTVALARHAAFADGVSRDIAAATAGDTARFTVGSDALGPVAVAIARDDGGAAVTMTVTGAAARDALDAARPALVAEARGHGVHVRDAQVVLAPVAAGAAPPAAATQHSLTADGYGGGGAGSDPGRRQAADRRPQDRTPAAPKARASAPDADGLYA